MWFGKLLSMAGVILLVLAVSPMGDFWDPRKSSLANTWRWIRNPRPDLATAVTVDPRFLYGGALCKPRYNFVYTRGDLSRPYRVSVTPQI
jgi:hypothetical protein